MTPFKSGALTRAASVHLDMLRGAAAIAVLVGHVRGLFFTDLQALEAGQRHAGVQAVYWMTSLGHQAVMVFFVLSGFFIGRSVLNSLGGWSWTPYVVNRLTRLYLVLVPALVLTAAVDFVAHGLPAGATFYERGIAHFNTQPYVERMNAATLLGNLAFLQNVYVGPFGSNSPLWSLANEFWYYALFPVLALAVTANRWRSRVMLGGMLLAGMVWLPAGLVAGFAIWLFGVAIHWVPTLDAHRRPVLAWLLAACCAALLAGALAGVKLFRIESQAGDFVVGAAAAAVVCGIVRIQWRTARFPAWYADAAGRLSKCSYSVYAVHFPIVMLVRVAMGTTRWAPTPMNLAYGGGLCVAIFSAGAVFARFTEAHTETVRRRVMKWCVRERRETVAAVG